MLAKPIAYDSDDAVAHNHLGAMLYASGKFDVAMANFQKALAISPCFAEAYSNLGNSLLKLGRPQEAENTYRKALDLKPNLASAHNNIGSAFYSLGRPKDAVASFEKALALEPTFAQAHFNLHSLLLDYKDLASAIKCMERAVEIDPSNTNYRFVLGMLWDYSGSPEKAKIHFDIVKNGVSFDRAKLDAWSYIKSVDGKLPLIIGSNIQAFKLGIDAAMNDGLVLEFGVWFGTSIRQIAALVKQGVHGFDSFEGLPEEWDGNSQGSFSTKGIIPSVPENVTLHEGWFEETLPDFVKKHPGPVRFMNIDCDIYSSTKTVLELLAKQIVSGTVIVFDEYIGNTSWRKDEFKAFQEAVLKHGWEYEYLCFSFMTGQVVVRIKS